MTTEAEDRDTHIINAAVQLHQAWMDMVNFRHPHDFSSRMAEAMEAREARRAVVAKYDEAFAQLTSLCELKRQHG